MPTPIEAGGMSIEEIELLLAYLIRMPNAMRAGLRVVRPDHFHADHEITYRLVWSAASDFFRAHDTLLGRDALIVEALRRLDNEYAYDDEEVRTDIREFVSWIFQVADVSGPDEVWRQLLVRFGNEREVREPLRRGMSSIDDIPDLLRDAAERAGRVQSAVASIEAPLIPEEGPIISPRSYMPSGVSFFDAAMEGGAARGEVNALLGPIGGGKTSLGVYYSMRMAQVEMARAISEPGYEPGHIYFVTYEMPVDDIRRKFLCAAATIPMRRWDEVQGDPRRLSTRTRPETLGSYELDLFGGDSGEQERFESVRPLGDIWHIINCRGGSAGGGGVDEIAAQIQAGVDNGRSRTNLVVIDYAKLAVYRYLEARNLDPTQHSRLALSKYGDECRRKLAEAFDCSVLVIQQLSGDANRLSPVANLTAAHAAECRTFHENMSFAFVCGIRCKRTGIIKFRPDKTRRADVSEPTLIRPTQFCTFEVVNDYIETPSGFVPRDFVDRIAEAPVGPVRNVAAWDGGDLDLGDL